MKEEERLYGSQSEAIKATCLLLFVREERERSTEMKGRRKGGKKGGGGRKVGEREGGRRRLYTFPSATNKAALPTSVCHPHHSEVKHCH